MVYSQLFLKVNNIYELAVKWIASELGSLLAYVNGMQMATILQKIIVISSLFEAHFKVPLLFRILLD